MSNDGFSQPRLGSIQDDTLVSRCRAQCIERFLQAVHIFAAGAGRQQDEVGGRALVDVGEPAEVLRVGERWVVRRTPLTTLYAIANKIALRIAQRGASRVVTRWLPVAGAVGVAGFVYVDTGKVAEAAIALFGGDVVIEGEAEAIVALPPAKRASRHRSAVTRSA